LIITLIDPLFLDNKEWDVATFNSFYEAEEDEVDVVFIGSSHLNKGIDTYIVDAVSKTSSIKISGGGMNVAQMYYNLKEVLTRQKPKLVVLETYALIEPNSLNNNLFSRSGKLNVRPFKSEYYKRFGVVKFHEISSIYRKNTPYHMFNTFRFHDVWSDLDNWSESLKAKFSMDPKKINQEFNRSFSTLNNEKIKAFRDTEFDTDEIYISKDENYFLNKIIDLSKDYDFKILFFTTPVLDVYYNETKPDFINLSNQLRSIIKEHKNIKFFDINANVNGFDKTRFNNGKVSYNQHLNYKGIINTSNILSEYLKENYTFDKIEKKNISIEDILYNTKRIEKSSSIEGNIEKVNKYRYRIGDSLTNTIRIPKNQWTINIEGWLLDKENHPDETIRKLAFKKGNNFIVITKGSLKTQKNNSIARRFGKEFSNTGFNFSFNRNSFEKGKYRIYGIVESKNGDFEIKDMWKWMVIE
jgi:hypothetical protein